MKSIYNTNWFILQEWC